jgi:hypothetical protein
VGRVACHHLVDGLGLRVRQDLPLGHSVPTRKASGSHLDAPDGGASPDDHSVTVP